MSLLKPHCDTCRCTTLPVTQTPTAAAVLPGMQWVVDYSRFTAAVPLTTFKLDYTTGAAPVPQIVHYRVGGKS